jgi:hypothetical protein
MTHVGTMPLNGSNLITGTVPRTSSRREDAIFFRACLPASWCLIARETSEKS